MDEVNVSLKMKYSVFMVMKEYFSHWTSLDHWCVFDGAVWQRNKYRVGDI